MTDNTPFNHQPLGEAAPAEAAPLSQPAAVPPVGAQPAQPQPPQPPTGPGTAAFPTPAGPSLAGYSAPPPPQGSGYSLPLPPAIPFMPPPPPPEEKSRGRKGAQGSQSLALIAISVALIILVSTFLVVLFSIGSGFNSLFSPTAYNVNTPSNSFSVIPIVGVVQSASGGSFGTREPSYLHGDTVAYIKSLAEDDDDKGILLYMNTPGGGVYEGDEVYLALMEYKEKTGRPIWVYMAGTCASAGYYISVAGDQLTANRNTTTGSIGVYIALTDTSGLYEKFGLRTVLVRSGDNKGVGVDGVPVTDENAAVYQGIVDEAYEQFLDVVEKGRGIDRTTLRGIADGRPYTGAQALELGLIDQLGDWETTLTAFEEKTGANAFYPSFSRRTALGNVIDSVTGMLPKGESETLLDLADQLPSGVPLSYYDPSRTYQAAPTK